MLPLPDLLQSIASIKVDYIAQVDERTQFGKEIGIVVPVSDSQKTINRKQTIMSYPPKKPSRRPRLYPRQSFFRSWFNKYDSSDPRGSGGRSIIPFFGDDKSKPTESASSTDGSKTNKVSSEGPDGKKVFKVKPKDLKICWKEESQFWSIPDGDGPAELLKVCWLDVSGEMDVTKGMTYEVSFMLSMNTEKSFGWDDPVTVMARIGKEGKYESKEIDLSKLSEEAKEFPLDHKCRAEFASDKETLYFGLYETRTNKWKGGLRIHEAIVQEIPAGNNIASTSNTRSEEIPAEI